MAAFAVPALVSRAAGRAPKKVIWFGSLDEHRNRVRQEFRARGILEGRDITLTFQKLPGGLEKEADMLADELVRSRPDLIVMAGHPTLNSLKARTRDIPVIFYDMGPNPAQVGLVESLARPGGNFTGSTMTGDQLQYEIRRWATFKQLVPSLKRAAILVGKDFIRDLEGRDPIWYAESKKILWAAGEKLGIEFVLLEVPREATRDVVARMVRSSEAQGVILQPYTGRAAADFIYSAPIPTFCWGFEPARKGCLLGFGYDSAEGEAYAIHAAVRVLRGDSPADIPVYVHNRIEFALNRRRARELGVDIPPSFLIRTKEIYD